jgi:4-hydroxy-3-polyprenylbenzoate decarboxylase
MKILVCISGASGASLGLRAYEELKKTEHEIFLVLSSSAKEVLKHESKENEFENKEIWAPPASGSFGIDATLIVPCSMNTLAKITCGISDNLVTRAAAVAMKERKKLLISPREMPFSQLYLEHMAKLASLGVIIAPPLLAYYSEQKTLEDAEIFLIGRWMDLIGIENNLYKKWKSQK